MSSDRHMIDGSVTELLQSQAVASACYLYWYYSGYTAQKMKFSIKDFFSKFDICTCHQNILNQSSSSSLYTFSIGNFMLYQIQSISTCRDIVYQMNVWILIDFFEILLRHVGCLIGLMIGWASACLAGVFSVNRRR